MSHEPVHRRDHHAATHAPRRQGRPAVNTLDGIGGLGAPAPDAFLSVRDLRVHFPTDDGLVKSVDGLSFDVARGKTLGIVGESGSGKSVTSMSIMGLHKPGTVTHDRLDPARRHRARSAPAARRVRELRGKRMAMIFQDPLSAMHPFYTVGHQIIEAYRIHNKVSTAVAKKHAIDMLGRVGIPEPSSRVDDYPHQFSGGMRQRAMIAMALSCDPDLLIADEPTTALDVTVQAQILDLIRDLQSEFNSAVVLITHDLGVVAELSDDIMVMYAGRAVEYSSSDDVFTSPSTRTRGACWARCRAWTGCAPSACARSRARPRASSTCRRAARSTRGARTPTARAVSASPSDPRSPRCSHGTTPRVT